MELLDEDKGGVEDFKLAAVEFGLINEGREGVDEGDDRVVFDVAESGFAFEIVIFGIAAGVDAFVDDIVELADDIVVFADDVAVLADDIVVFADDIVETVLADAIVDGACSFAFATTLALGFAGFAVKEAPLGAAC